MSTILGIDIGGSGIKGAPVNTQTGELLAERHRIPTPAGGKPEDVAQVIRQIMEHFGHTGPLGVTFPGIIQHGKVLSAANMDKGWVNLEADALLTKVTGQEVHLVNDADAAGLAEAKFGNGKGVEGLVMVLTFGTGIGSAVLHHGLLLPNTELGHLYLKGERHAESFASDRAREKHDLNWKEWGTRATEYLRHLELLFSPDLFIIGGGVSKKAEKWLPYVKPERTKLLVAALKNDAGIIGAALEAEYLAAH